MKIETDRLLLRSMDSNELGVICQVQWLNDPEVVRYSEQRHKLHTFKSQKAYIARFQSGPHKFLQVLLEDRPIGSLTAYIDQRNGVANVGILIGDKAKWGHGYGFEAWAAFCDHLLNKGTRKIEAGMMAENFGMRNICRKYEMIEEARIADHFLFNGNPMDMLLFGKTK